MSDSHSKEERSSSGKPAEFSFPPLHEEDVSASPSSGSRSETENSSPSAPQGKTPLLKKEKIKEWMIKNKTTALVVAFVVIALGMWGIKKMRGGGGVIDPIEGGVPIEQLDEIPVNAIEAKLGRFQDDIKAVGTIKGEAEIELRFQVDGRIEELNVTPGRKVRRGEIIGRLNERDAMLKVQRAKNELEQTEKLYQLGGVSRTKLDEARLNLDVAQSELDKTRLTATRDGIVGEREADVGEFVTPQRKVSTLVSIKNVVVKVGIIEKQVDKVSPGQKILVSVDAYPGNIFEGTIESISPIIGGEGKTFEITAKIPNADSLLLPGMFARTRVITYEADDAISVPSDALIKSQTGFQLFVVNKDNVAEARDVQIGYSSTENTQVTAGIAPGEIVIIQKPPELKAGSKVKIIEVQR
ncbi:MAG: Multidrug resistance protein MdtA [Elusimicrobia bacterium]|nr:Multidrug resistance protein MdtA [Elusimicrobiota bacterium]